MWKSSFQKLLSFISETTQSWTMKGDYKQVIGTDGKTRIKFLKDCSAQLDPSRCTDVESGPNGTIIVTVKGMSDDLKSKKETEIIIDGKTIKPGIFPFYIRTSSLGHSKVRH